MLAKQLLAVSHSKGFLGTTNTIKRVLLAVAQSCEGVGSRGTCPYNGVDVMTKLSSHRERVGLEDDNDDDYEE